ncbi:MAG: DUF1080 domain-containing protein [Pirellulaceae bacterium]
MLAASPLAALADKGDRPNILFIIVDDQSPFDLKVYNPDSRLETPNIDRLAKQGVVFDGAHHMGAWVGAVCTPSRHMVMCGRTVWHLPNRSGRGNNPLATNPGMAPPDLAEQTMGAVFNRAGYDTMRTCKRGNSYAAANQQFTVVHEATKRGGTEESGSAWHAERVLDYLNEREANNDADPFLIYFGFSHPHDTRDGTPQLLAKYGAVNHKDPETIPPADEKQPPLPVNYLPEHPFFHGHPGLRDEDKVSGVWKRRDERTIRNELGREFACGENIDIQIGRVLQKLEAMGELDNTYIIYTADHGMAIGRHGLQGKQNLYEHTWRVPLIVKGPGIQPARARGNIYLLDVLPSLCDLAGIETPKTVEGVSFKPVLEGKRDVVRDVLYGVYCGGTKPGMRCVKQGDWKLIKYDVMDGEVRRTQLFNLAENPHEFLAEHQRKAALETNLADNPKFAQKRREMEALLLSEMQRLDDPYRLWDQPTWKVGEAISLFDGKTLAGWTTQDGKPVTAGWKVTDGAIHRESRGGNIFFEQPFGDFELSFEWKIVAGGNNGLKYRVRNYGNQTLGCEYQLLGDSEPKFTKGSTGSLYALYEPNENVKLNAVGEWNTAKIVAHGPRIEHWLNGEKIVEADVASDEWRKRLSQSKFAKHQDFARNTIGRIMLTDHGSPVWYRNLKLTPLPPQVIPPLSATSAYEIKQPTTEQAKQYKLDASFYKKCTLVQDILIATSDQVSDDAIREAAYQFDMIMKNIRPQVARRIREKQVLCLLIGHAELTSDLPQFATDKTGQELDFYNWRQRGFLTHKEGRPTVVFAEEDVLEYEGGMQLESILVHEFGHVIHGAGFDEALQKRLTETFERARAKGIWMDGRAAQRFRRVESDTPISLLDALVKSFPDQPKEFLRTCLDGGDILVNDKPVNADAKVVKDDRVLIVFGGEKECYAHKNRAEYWAEGVQCWYNTNRTMDHDHNHIHTREQLQTYDPHLAELCQDVLGDSPWRFVSPRERAGSAHLAKFDPANSPVAVDPDHIKEAANDYYDTYWKDYWRRLRDKHAVDSQSP